jgi:chromosome condensin MukBEF ATPase and DNA-binding subunit MukB
VAEVMGKLEEERNKASKMHIEHAEAIHSVRMEFQARINEGELRMSEARSEREELHLELENLRARHIASLQRSSPGKAVRNQEEALNPKP